jgi:hypothetical protein
LRLSLSLSLFIIPVVLIARFFDEEKDWKEKLAPAAESHVTESGVERKFGSSLLYGVYSPRAINEAREKGTTPF